MKVIYFFIISFFLFICVLSSCVDVSGTVDVKNNGAGSVLLIYRLSKTIESLGKLEANSEMLPIPVSKEDFERTAARIAGLSVKSWKEGSDADNIIITVELNFDSLTTLAKFLDPEGKKAEYRENGTDREFILRLAEKNDNVDPELKNFVQTVFTGYNIDLNFKFASTLVSATPGILDSSKRSAKISIPVKDAISGETEVIWILRWQQL